jgi:hypothetical protein
MTKQKRYYEKRKLLGYQTYTVRDLPEITEKVKEFYRQLKETINKPKQ